MPAKPSLFDDSMSLAARWPLLVYFSLRARPLVQLDSLFPFFRGEEARRILRCQELPDLCNERGRERGADSAVAMARCEREARGSKQDRCGSYRSSRCVRLHLQVRVDSFPEEGIVQST